MADTSARWTVVARLLERLQGHERLTDVGVTDEHPGDQIKPESAYLSNVEGDTFAMPLAMAGRKARDDEFRLVWTITVTLRQGPTETIARASDIVAAFDDVLAEDPTLGDLPLLVSAHLSNVNGPMLIRTDKGRFAIAEAVVSCHMRLE